MSDIMLRINEVGKTYANKTILQNISFHLTRSDRIGIVGSNGSGKSTLLDIIAGRTQSDSGTLQWLKHDCTTHYLTQARDEAWQGSPNVEDVILWSMRLGLNQDLLHGEDRRWSNFSGGERTKHAIATAWSSRADLLILDEPTNHLDTDGIAWLIDHVKKYPGAVLIVSHDRYFLDQTVRQIIELRSGQTQIYHGNYSFFVQERERTRLAEIHQFEKKEREQARLEQQIEQLKRWAEDGQRKAGKQGTLSERKQLGYKQYQRSKVKKLEQRVKSQIKRIERLKLEQIARPTQDAPVQFDFPDASSHGKFMLEAKNLGKTFGNQILFEKSSFYVQRGERIGLFGPNGCGKTTLLRMILGEESATQGELWLSPTTKVAYLSQREDGAHLNVTMASFERDMSAEERARFRSILAHVGLDHTKLWIPLAQLSLGERTRFQLARVVLGDYNLLVLDEPTNHLDITSREELEQALESYQGTLLLVTHDLYLMDRICDKRLVFHKQRIKKVDRDWHEDVDDHVGVRKREQKHSHEPTQVQRQARKDELMVIEIKIAQRLGDLSTVTLDHPQYKVLDEELNTLLSRRKQLQSGV